MNEGLGVNVGGLAFGLRVERGSAEDIPGGGESLHALLQVPVGGIVFTTI
jgi:hypothetical protein